MDHVLEASQDVAMRLGPNGVVVDEVCCSSARWLMSDQTDATADLKCMRLLEDVLCCRAFGDAQEVADVIDGQWLYRCRLVQLELLVL